MSIISTLALMATAIVARVRKDPPEITKLKSDNAIIAELQAQVDDLNRQFDERDERLANVEQQRDGWKSLALAYGDVMRQRERSVPLPQLFTSEATRQNVQAQQAQTAQMAQTLANAGFAQQPQHWDGCNCVPARQDAFRGVMNGE